jgi:hypothetical protein
MAYRQEPGRGPMATFKNVTALLGPTVTEGEEERGKEKVTRESKTDINPETGMKRLTITTTRSGGSGGGTSYRDAYKKADKAKYPTLEGFVEAAKAYKKKDVRVVEQIPTREAKITTSSKPELRTIETTKKPETSITIEKKKKQKTFDGSGVRKAKKVVRDIQTVCKRGLLKKGGKCIRKTEGKRSKITKFKKTR